MSAARIFTPENRLAGFLDSLGGTATDVLVENAEHRVEAMVEGIREFVAEKLLLILPFAEEDDQVLFAECRTLAETATQIAEVAAAGKLHSIGEIALGISAMVNGLLTVGVWHSEALRVHIRALELVARARPPADRKEDPIVENLRQMRTAIGLRD